MSTLDFANEQDVQAQGTIWGRMSRSQTDAKPEGGRDYRPLLDSVLRIQGRSPEDYVPARQMDELPRENYDSGFGYSQDNERMFFDALLDRDAIRYTAARSGQQSPEVMRVAEERAQRKALQKIDALIYPENDIDAIADGLSQAPAKIPREYIEELNRTDEGRKSLRDMWVETQTGRVSYSARLENHMYAAEAISADAAVLLSDVRRLAEDTFGGKARAAMNLGKDFIYGVANTSVSAATGVASSALTVMSAIEATKDIPRYNPWTGERIEDDRVYGPLTKQESEARYPFATMHDQFDELSEMLNSAVYRAPAQQGSPFYTSFLSPLAQGAGSTVPFLALGTAPSWLRYAVGVGVGRNEAYESALAYGVSPENARLVALAGGLISGALEMVGTDSIIRAWRTPSPGAQMARNIFGSVFGEGGTEALQSLTSSASAEAALALEGNYSFDPERAWDAVDTALVEGGFGAILGGGFGLAGMNFSRTMVKELGYRGAQRFLDGGVERLSKVADVRDKPTETRQVVDDIMNTSNAPGSMFIEAAEFVNYFQGDDNRMQKAMDAMEVTPQQLETAREAGAQIEVSTAGLMFHSSANPADAELRRWAQPSPEAPTMALLAEEALAEKDIATELRAIQESNEPLPEPFKEFRSQLIDARLDAEGAQYSTDILYALSKVMGKRMGLTPEQFLNLNPIKVMLSRQLAKARAVDNFVMQGEERMAAQDVVHRAQAVYQSMGEGEIQNRITEMQALSPEERVARGVADITAALDGQQDAPGAVYADDLGLISFIFGTPGEGAKFKKGSGLAHIFAKRRAEAVKAGATPEAADQIARSVIERIPDVIVNGERRPDKFNADRMHVIKDGVTAIITRFDDGGNTGWVLTGWDEGLHGNSLPGEPGGVSPGPDYAPGSSSIRRQEGAGRDILTIPADPTNVNQWNAESIDTIMAQAGVAPDQADGFKRFVKSMLDNNADVSDVSVLGRDFETSVMLAEGLEQSVRGLERILASPDTITQAVLDSLGIDAGTVQEGIAEIRQLAEDRARRARAYREFYTDPEMLRLVQNTSRDLGGQGWRGDVFMTPESSVIRLFHGRQDRSTIMHELFHVYSGHLARAAKMEGAPAQLVADFNTLNEAVGGGLDSSNPDVRRAADERAAPLFERYLFEGNEPHPGLADAFRRFRIWMTNIYRQVRNIGDLELTPEVRGVFDRMLATEEDIAQADIYYRTLDTLAPPSGATEEQASDITQKAERARATAEERQYEKTLEELLASQGGRKQMRRESSQEIDRQPQYQAIKAIRNGGGISREIAVSEIGAEGAQRIANAHGKLFRESPGMDVTAMHSLAIAQGYDSVADMLTDISNSAKRLEVVNQVQAQKIAEAETLVRLAMEQDSATPVDEAYHSDALSDAFAAKQAVLDRQAVEQARTEGRRVERQLTNAALKRIAEDFIANQDSRRGSRYFEFVNAYRKHAEASVRADAAGDKITAAKEYQQMRLNHYIIKEAIRAKNDVKSFEKKNTRYNEWMKRLDGRDKNGMAPVEESYRNSIRSVLARWKVVHDPRIAPAAPADGPIAVPGPNPATDPEIASYAPPLNDYVSPWILEGQEADQIRTWRDLTVEQIRELGAALDILTKKGRGELKGLKSERARTRQEMKTELLRTLELSPDYKGKDDRKKTDPLRRFVEGYLVSNYQISRIAAEIDGNPMLKGEEMGLMQRIVGLIRGAEVKQMVMLDAFKRNSKADYDVMDGMVKRMKLEFKSNQFLIDGFPMPEIIQSRKFRKTWDADMIRAIFFNMGNESNLTTLKDAYGFSDAHLQKLSSLATEAEWRAIENIGKRVGELYAQLDEVFFRQTNKHLDKVQPTPITITTKDGKTITLDGWYYPKKYDPELTNAVAKNKEMADLLETMNGVFNRNKLERGFTNRRQENVKHPILLDTKVLVDHMTVATRWITHAEALLEFDAITTDPDVQNAMIDKIGREKYRYIREWAGRMAKPDKGSMSGMNRLFSKLRNASTVASLGLNMRSALRQNESFGIAADMMSNASRTKQSGWSWLYQGFKDMGLSGYLGGFVPGMQSQAVTDMYEMSAVARMRAGNVNKEIRELNQGADPTKSSGLRVGKLRLSRDMFFHFTTAMDQGVSGICWWGAYRQAESGNAGFDVSNLSDAQIREKSIAYADEVLLSQQSPFKADITAFQADPGIQSLFTQFMGGVTPYLSHTAGMTQAWRRGDKTAVDMMRHLINVYALPAFGYSVAFSLLKRALLGADDDDDESLTGKFAWGVLGNLTAPLPGVRDVVGMAQYGRQDLELPSLSMPFKVVASSLRGFRRLTEGDVNKAGSDFGRALAPLIPVRTPLRQAQELGEALGIIEEE